MKMFLGVPGARAARKATRRLVPYGTGAGGGGFVIYALQQEEEVTAGQVLPLFLADAIDLLDRKCCETSHPATLGYIARVAQWWGTHSSRLAQLQLEHEMRSLALARKEIADQPAADTILDDKAFSRLVLIANQTPDHAHHAVAHYAALLASTADRGEEHLRMLVDATERYKKAMVARRQAKVTSAYDHAHAVKKYEAEHIPEPSSGIAVFDAAKVEEDLAKAWALYAHSSCSELPAGLASGLSNLLQRRIARAQMPSPSDLATGGTASRIYQTAKGNAWFLTQCTGGAKHHLTEIGCLSDDTASNGEGKTSGGAFWQSTSMMAAVAVGVTAAGLYAAAVQTDRLPPPGDLIRGGSDMFQNLHMDETLTQVKTSIKKSEKMEALSKNVIVPINDYVGKRVTKLTTGAKSALASTRQCVVQRVTSDNWTFLGFGGSHSASDSSLDKHDTAGVGGAPEINA
ncbi:unnamed protein product [Amoebophrya sp. A25]|nr:unnamed protein product [Amoebophrya sp. A25]|eukprot:GSA25T00024467001.1